MRTKWHRIFNRGGNYEDASGGCRRKARLAPCTAGMRMGRNPVAKSPISAELRQPTVKTSYKEDEIWVFVTHIASND